MKQEERRKYLIEYLLSEINKTAEIPNDADGQRRLFRALVNVRMPKEASAEFLRIPDAYRQEEFRR